MIVTLDLPSDTQIRIKGKVIEIEFPVGIDLSNLSFEKAKPAAAAEDLKAEFEELKNRFEGLNAYVSPIVIELHDIKKRLDRSTTIAAEETESTIVEKEAPVVKEKTIAGIMPSKQVAEPELYLASRPFEG